jgi:hypothetical protein
MRICGGAAEKSSFSAEGFCGSLRFGERLYFTISDATYPGASRAVSRACDAAGFWSKILQSAESGFTLLNLVSTDCGVAIMPDPEAYRYRDWVVQSFNDDLPYDEFIRQQFAGDLLPGPDGGFNTNGVIATGLMAIGEWGTGDADKEKMLTDIVDDQIDVTGRAFLWVTLACARCHDHKFARSGETTFRANISRTGRCENRLAVRDAFQSRADPSGTRTH